LATRVDTAPSINAVADSDDVLTRLAVLETAVVRLREEAALSRTDALAARVLAAGDDHDVSEVRAELRAHTQALNALRETQLERQAETHEGFAVVTTGLAQITTLLHGIADTSGDLGDTT